MKSQLCGLHKVTSEGLKVPTVYSELPWLPNRMCELGSLGHTAPGPCVVMQPQVQVEAAVQKLLLLL